MALRRQGRRNAQRHCLRTFAKALGILLCLFSMLHLGRQLWEREAYRQLSERGLGLQDERSPEQGDPHDGASPALDQLRQTNPDFVAWLTVDGTDISLPVVQLHDDTADPSFYLHHDFWKREAVSGVPFLDRRCTPETLNRLVYGHHLPVGGQFSQLQKSYLQEVFDRLGVCTWHEPEKEKLRLQPLCALEVDQYYAKVQRFTFEHEGALCEWLTSLCTDSTSIARDWEEVVAHSQSVVTLVTCSSDWANQPWRTLVIFAEANT